MKRVLYYIFSLLFVTLLSGCEKESNGLSSVYMGESENYPSFWWEDESLVYAEKTITFNFNDDAKKWNSKLLLKFMDEQNVPLDLSKFIVKIDNVELKKPEYEVSANQSKIKVNAACRPNVEGGDKAIVLAVESNTIETVDNMDLIKGQTLSVKNLSIKHNVRMNPLKFTVLTISAIIVSLLLLWLLILKKVIFPQFKNMNKTISIPNQAPIFMRMKGCREIVVSNVAQKQGFWDKVFKGEVRCYVHPSIVSPIRFVPNRRGVMVKANPSQYRVNPNPMPLIGKATIQDLISKVNITVA